MLFEPATNTPHDGFGVADVNPCSSLIPIPTPADNPKVITSFVTDYVQKRLSHLDSLEPFILFASLQRPELFKRASVDIGPVYPTQPIPTAFGVIDETIIKELAEEFWQSLDDNEQAQWKALANDIQRLWHDVIIDDIRRISQDLFGEWSETTEAILPAGWIDVQVQRITIKCLLRSPKVGIASPIDVNTHWGPTMNEAIVLPSGSHKNDSVDVDALWNEVFGHWTNEDWETLAAAAATVESQSPPPFHFGLPTPESMNGDMELEYETESQSEYISSELESSDTNPEPELECEPESDEC